MPLSLPQHWVPCPLQYLDNFESHTYQLQVAQPSFIKYFELDTRPDATSLISTANGLFQAGAFFGALMITPVAENFGRKMAITVPAILVLISGALLAGSVKISMFLVFRFVAGAGSWMLLGSVPIWMTEVVPPKNRGLLVDIHSAALLLGYCSSSWAGFGFSHYDSVSPSIHVVPRLLGTSRLY